MTPRIITLTPNPTHDYAAEAEFVAPNRKIRCTNPHTHPGGGGVNVARTTSRLGMQTLAIITAGGVSGEALKLALAQEGVPIRVIEVAAETRVAFHVRNIAGANEYRFNLPGAPMERDEIDHFYKAVDEETSEGDFVVGSGSLPPDTPDDFWARTARIAKKNGARFVLDSVSGLDAAMEEGFFLLRLNKFEYPAIAGGELSWPDGITAFAQNLIRKGKIQCVAITHGADGSIMAAPEGVFRTNVIETQAQSTVGAGDSFVGGMLTAILRGWSYEKALRYGAAAAAATRTAQGAALFDAADVERLFKQ